MATRRTPLRPAARRATPARPSAPAEAPTLYVLSDSTGNLARHMLATYLTQFPAGSVTVRYETFVKDAARVNAILSGVGPAGAAICHAVVAPGLKRVICELCQLKGVPSHDLTGPGMAFLTEVIGAAPRPDLAALHPIDRAYRRRIDAVEFTLAHDDGLGLDTLANADVVLTGVSRTSKSPTCILLAQQGYRAANVPLAPGVEPPQQLLALPPGKVVGLYADPRQLAAIRQRREAGWGGTVAGYGDDLSVSDEVAWSRRLFARRGWPSLDITDQAVEETAARVVRLLGLQPPCAEDGARSWHDLPAVPPADCGGARGGRKHV